MTLFVTENVNIYVLFDLLAFSELAQIFMHAIVNGVSPLKGSVIEWAIVWHEFMLPFNSIELLQKQVSSHSHDCSAFLQLGGPQD